MIKYLISAAVYWYPVWVRQFVYLSLAFFTTLLDKTADIKNFTDFNLFAWSRTFLFCWVACLIVARAYIDDTPQQHKISKVKSGDTSHMKKSDIDKIRRDLGLAPIQ